MILDDFEIVSEIEFKKGNFAQIVRNKNKNKYAFCWYDEKSGSIYADRSGGGWWTAKPTDSGYSYIIEKWQSKNTAYRKRRKFLE